MKIFRMYTALLLWMLICLALLRHSTGDDPCPAFPPCDCKGFGYSINCDSRNLTEVPRFNISVNRRWWVDLSFNNITHIPSQAFRNIIGMYYLKMENSQIETIATDALLGAEETLNFFFVRNNKLKEVPLALGQMKAVSSVGIEGNPIPVLNPGVMKNISSTLQYLTIGFPGLTSWPQSIQYLKNLTSLSVRDISMEYLPISAFLGLENSLGLLGFDRCNIRSLPLSLSTLNALDVLSLEDNPHLQLSGISGEAFSGIKRLSEISIRNQSFNTLPNIFHDALSVRDIETSDTPITHIEASLIPDVNNFESVRLENTLLRSIPPAISKMKSLQTLIITNSSVSAVSSDDFAGMKRITYIGIINAPLTSFAEDALRDTFSLQWLFLSGTNLTTIPKAIRGLRNLRNVDLEGNKIICTCESLGWLKDWNGSDFFIPIGDCFNLKNVSLAGYYREEVPKCPNTVNEP